MPFSTHLQSLSKIHDTLLSLEQPTQIQILVREATGHIIQNCTMFNGCVTLDTPFLREFFTSINTTSFPMGDENSFALFECLAIFFREKRLRLGAEKLAAPEQAVLTYFENSGHWSPSQTTLINDWYWHKLPKKIIEDSIHGFSPAK